MMNDRFSAQLRQHLLETADERPADGQLASVVDGIAVTRQRHPLLARLTWTPGRIGPVSPVALRSALVTLALLAAVAAAVIVAGGGGRSTVFEGTWTSVDVFDGSRQSLVVAPGSRPDVHYEDEVATGGACDDDVIKRFKAEGLGVVSGTRLDVSFPDGGGCVSVMVPIVGMFYVYDPASETLFDYLGNTWYRIEGSGGQAPATQSQMPPAAAPSAEPTPAEPPATEPTFAEPPATEPPATEPTPAEPPATEPASTEPFATESTPTHGLAPDPPATQAPPTAPASMEPATPAAPVVSPATP